VAAQLGELRGELAALQGLTVQFNNLDARANQLKESYQLYAQKRDQAQIEDAMDEQKLMNIAVAQHPTLSYVVTRPKPLLNALLGAVTALFLGLSAVYFAETGRTTIATPRELDAVSRYPLLATVPLLSLRANHIVKGTRRTERLLLSSLITRPLRHAFLNFWRDSRIPHE
jgi:hypothetical protein